MSDQFGLTTDEVRAEVSIWDVLDQMEIDYQIDGQGESMISAPDRAERTPSLHVSDSVFFDFGNRENNGTVIDFVKIYVTGGNFGRAMKWLTRLIDGGDVTGGLEIKEYTKPEPVNLIEDFFRGTSPLGDDRTWLKAKVKEKWGLELEHLRAWGVRVGPGDSLHIPHFHPFADAAHMVHIRDLTPGTAKPKYSYKGSMATGLYAWWHDDTAPWVLCEGEPDSWAMKVMLGSDWMVYGLPTGAGVIREEWFEGLDMSRGFSCMDRGSAGETATEKLQSMGLRPIGLPPASEGKDVADMYRGGWRLAMDLDGEIWTKIDE